METIYPLIFHEALTDAQLLEKECGDGIYVSMDRFSTFMNAEGSELVTLAIKKGALQRFCHIIGTHSEGPDCVYAPSWICQQLGATGGEFIELVRVHPVTGNTITIKPHTSGYNDLDDPAAELRNAFERYSCIEAGLDIPLYVGGETLIVSVIDNGVGEPICIRGIELSVEIATPLDQEAAVAAAEAKRQEEALAEVKRQEEALAEAKRQEEASALNKRFPGRGRRLGDGATTYINWVACYKGEQN